MNHITHSLCKSWKGFGVMSEIITKLKCEGFITSRLSKENETHWEYYNRLFRPTTILCSKNIEYGFQIRPIHVFEFMFEVQIPYNEQDESNWFNETGTTNRYQGNGSFVTIDYVLEWLVQTILENNSRNGITDSIKTWNTFFVKPNFSQAFMLAYNIISQLCPSVDMSNLEDVLRGKIVIDYYKTNRSESIQGCSDEFKVQYKEEFTKHF